MGTHGASIPWRWLGAALLVIVPAFAQAAESEWAARYHVRFGVSAGGAPKADVEATLRWIGTANGDRSRLEVGMAEDGFPRGYGTFVHGFRAVVPRGARRPRTPYRAETLSAPEGRYRIAVLSGGVVGFSYSVVLEHDPAGWGPGPDEAPYRFEEGAFWTGRALFVTAPRSRTEVTFTAPEGDRVLTSFEPAPGSEPNTFTVPEEQRLRDCFLVVGRPAAVDLEVGEATVTLVLGGALKQSLPMLSEAMARFLGASRALFGGAPRRRILAVGNVGGRKGSFDGGTYGNDLSFLVDEPLGAHNSSRWRPFLAHELFHLWNGNGQALDYEESEYWMSEGFTDYYARVLLVRLGDLPAEELLADLRQRMARYLWRRSDLGLQQAGGAKFANAALVYEGGSLAALCLDLQIRAATSNTKSLDDVMKALYTEFSGSPRKKVGIADVIRVTSSVAGRPFAGFFARHVIGNETLPLTESLKLAGIRVAPLIRLPGRRWIAVDAAGIGVLRSEGEPLHDGDVISEVAGVPVRTFDDLRVALGGVAPGATVALTITRDGKRTPIDLTLGGDASMTRSQILSVSADVVPALDPLTLTIRRSIFGTELQSRSANDGPGG